MLKQLLRNKLKRSHILLFGSLLVFGGVLTLSWNYLLKLRGEVFSDMQIAMMDADPLEEVIDDTPIVNNLPTNDNNTMTNETTTNYEVDYSKYLGVLEIPRIGLKRGFYNTDSKYNNIQYNVTMVKGSSLPDVQNGNLILIAHSGDAYISFFAYLYRLNIGDFAYVTYNQQKYTYQIVNIYTVPKKGVVPISRNNSKTTLTLVTCTKDTDNSQTIYIAELV